MANLFKKYISGLVTLILSLGIVVPSTYLSNIPLTKAATYSVTNTADSGAGSLRQAVLDANGNPGTDTVSFTATGTITLLSTIDIIQAAIIDGTTAPDDIPGSADIILAGSSSIDCFTLSAGDGTTIYGIGFSGCRKGIVINNQGVSNAQIGGTSIRQNNYIYGSTSSGISIEAGNGINVHNNYIGTLGANNVGVSISGGDNINIGGDGALNGNEIVSSTAHGIDVISGTGVNIRANAIGMMFGGAPLGNGQNGINVQTGSSVNTLLGGSDLTSNIIVNNAANGILIGSTTQMVTIKRNYIGITATVGLAGNAQNGISMTSGLNTIGGNTSNQRNYISGNGQNGILLSGPSAMDNLIKKTISVQMDREQSL